MVFCIWERIIEVLSVSSFPEWLHLYSVVVKISYLICLDIFSGIFVMNCLDIFSVTFSCNLDSGPLTCDLDIREILCLIALIEYLIL